MLSHLVSKKTCHILFQTIITIFLLAGLARGNGGTLTFTDITLQAGTGGPTGTGNTGGHGAMFADVNADGRPDLYITMNFETIQMAVRTTLPPTTPSPVMAVTASSAGRRLSRPKEAADVPSWK